MLYIPPVEIPTNKECVSYEKDGNVFKPTLENVKLLLPKKSKNILLATCCCLL